MDRQAAVARETKFRELLVRLFAIHGVAIEPHRGGNKNRRFDLLVRSAGGTAVVEIKIYSTLHVAEDSLKLAIQSIAGARDSENSGTAILATNAKISPVIKKFAKDSRVVIYDYDILYWLAEKDAELYSELDAFFQGELKYRSAPLPEPERAPTVEFITPPTTGVPPLGSPKRVHPRGGTICSQLRSSSPGKKSGAAAAFEKLCLDAFEYLFKDDFAGFVPQKSSHKKMHRYDVISRITSKNDFWNAVITDHRSRYLILEFKNYGKKITQQEIYSTEKYLLPNAMRAFSVIVSRLGFNDNAFAVSCGALREQGKVIIGLNIEEMCEMLHLKDGGGDPADVIARKLDELLMGLER